METQARPNFLWICADQLRRDALGSYGNEFVKTPNLDELARTGVQFDNCYSQSPVCTPSRASFLTGRYPRTIGLRQNGQCISSSTDLITRQLADAGYSVGLAGKLHLAACNPSVTTSMEPRTNDGYGDFHWSHHPDPDWPTNEYIHWLREKGATYGTAPYQRSRYVEAGMPSELHHTTWCAEKAINFIEGFGGAPSPWMFSVNLFDPHHPFDPPVEYLERYSSFIDDVPLPNYEPGELENKPRVQQIDHAAAYNTAGLYPFAEMSAEDHRLIRAAYWAMVDHIDAQVSRMLTALDRSGQRENTVIIFTSDHGEMLGDHGIYLKGPYFYEPAVGVPLIISLANQFSPGRRDSLVELMDLAPTIIELAGVSHSDGVQARSLVPSLYSASATHRTDVYSEYLNAMPWHPEQRPWATMLRTGTHKVVLHHDDSNTGELYDLTADAAETRNLWYERSHSDLRFDLVKRLCDRIAHTADPAPRRVANW